MTENVSKQFAIIAGSGFGGFAEGSLERAMTTRFGEPSAPVRELSYPDHKVFTLARHGDAHDIAPHCINYRANLMALKLLDVDHVIALNTVGAIPLRIKPGQLAVPEQLIDYTWGRKHSIYEDGNFDLDHIDFSQPFSEPLRLGLLAAAEAAGITCHDGGVYGVTQGPRLETVAEVDRFEREGIDYLGMTAMPEAAIARELGIEYACLSLVVNPAAGRGEASIHDAIEASTQTARMQAFKVLKQFFSSES